MPRCSATCRGALAVAVAVAAPLLAVLPAASASAGTSARIRDIQGAGHTSPMSGARVTEVPGVVTALRRNGYYLQDPDPDGNAATSEGIFVFTSAVPTVAVGDSLLVTGTVSEFRPGGAAAANPTTTQIGHSPTAVAGPAATLPAPVVLGVGGRVPPTTVIDDDAAGDVESGGTFDADTDGIDFYESLEGMRVTVADAAVMDGTNRFGEIPVLADGGVGASPRTPRGGILYGSYADGNPERIQLDDEIVRPLPQVDVGDRLSGVIGVVDYSFGNFKVELTQLPTVVEGSVTRETAQAAGPGQLSLATFNVENLAPVGTRDNSQAKFDALAAQLVQNLRSPDLVTLEEVQDDNGQQGGCPGDGVVTATKTYDALRAAILAAGGPDYAVAQIDPADCRDGGAPSGNIRVGFLYRTDRGLEFVRRGSADANTPTSVTAGPDGPQLSVSPGRVSPADPAWEDSRKPLAGEFTYPAPGGRQRLFVVGNHFSSKGGDQPLFGRFQPPVRSSETKRLQQSQLVADFVRSILAVDPQADVAVLGDLNDFTFSPVLGRLEAAGLTNLFSTVPEAERYDYVFEGNSQALDHILVSRQLLDRAAPQFDAVHVNAEYADQTSDHDPEVALLTPGAGAPPVVPEVPAPLLLPVMAMLVAGGLVARRRRLG